MELSIRPVCLHILYAPRTKYNTIIKENKYYSIQWQIVVDCSTTGINLKQERDTRYIFCLFNLLGSLLSFFSIFVFVPTCIPCPSERNAIAFQKRWLKIELSRRAVSPTDRRMTAYLKFKGDLQAIVKLETGKVT